MRPFLLACLLFSASSIASPGQEMAIQLLEAEADGLLGAGDSSTTGWWMDFGDADLSQAIETSLNGNPELGTAWARANLAKAATMQSASALMPTAQFQVSSTLSPTNTMGFGVFSSIMPDMSGYFAAIGEALEAMSTGPDGQPTYQFPEVEDNSADDPGSYLQGTAMLGLSLPIDIMGRNTLNWRASKHEAQAAQGSQQAQAIALATMTGQAYFDLMSANATLELVKAQVQNQRDLLELVDLGFQKGAARSTDVLQQRQQLAASEARVPAALQGKKFAEEGLRRLLGTAPGNVGAVFPTIAAAPAAGSAAELLKARPDLKAAAHNWDAARLKRISAQRAYGPSLSLNGQVGWQYYQFEEFDSIQTWGAGATANVPVFSGGRIASGVRAAKANEQIANHSLRGSTLTVLQELRTSTVADTAAEETLAAITRQQEAAKAAFDEAKAQYQRGVISYIQVLPILIASQVADLSAIEAQRQRVNARIQLHDTIGGTWPNQLTSDGVTP